MTASAKLTTLGSLSLEIAGKPVLSGRRKPLTLLAYVTRRPEVKVRRLELASLFWPGADEPRARQSLRQTLTELREALNPGLGVTDQQVWVEPGALWLDANAFSEAVRQGRMAEALRLWTGDFLPEAESTGDEEFRTWLEAEREDLRRKLASAATAEIQRLAAQASWTEAGVIAKQWTGWAPQDERAARRLVEILVMAGRRTEAASEYAAATQRLQQAGLPLSPEWLALGSAAEKPEPDPKLSVFALLSPDLVGRADALAAWRALWLGVQRGAASSLVIEGDIGSGKSRLLEELVRIVRGEGRAIAFHARAFEAEGEARLALVRHLFATLARAPALATSPPAVLQSLARWIPEIGEAFPHLSGEGTVPIPEAIARAIADVSAETPVLIAVDDAHLADRESHAVLEALSRRPLARSMIVLCAPAEAAGNFAGTRIQLANLDPAGIEQLVASMAEFGPADRRVLVDRLMTETRGNPLAVVEIVRALAELGAIGPAPDGSWTTRNLKQDAPLPVPVSLRDAALARTRKLGDDSRTVLEAAAVVGRELDPEILLGLTGLGSDRLDRALEDLLGRRLLRAAPDGSSRLEFAHEHLRRGVYESLSPIRRSEWQQRLARQKNRSGRRPGAWRRPWFVAAAAAAIVIVAAGWRWYFARKPVASDTTAVRTTLTAEGDTIFGFQATAGSLAWVQTRSFEALKAYAEAERLFGAHEVPEAIQAYRLATRQDTALAVAWYRIGESGLWLLRSDVARVGADSALHYVSGINPTEVVHYRAFRDFARGNIEEAESKLRGEIAVFPRRTESRYLLADLLFHFYWLKGSTSREARVLFEGLRRDQPGDWRPLVHLWDIAVMEGRTANAVALRDTIQQLAPAADLFDGYEAITAFAAADSAGRRGILDSLSGRDQWTLANIIRRYASLTRDAEGTLELSGLLLGADRPPEVRATGHLFRSVALLGQGQFSRAREEAGRAAALSPIVEFQWASLVLGSGLPPGGGVDEERRRLRETLARSGGIPLVPLSAPYYPWTDFDKRDAEDIFPYLRGRLALGINDSVGAMLWLGTLEDTTGVSGELRPFLATSLRAAIAGYRGDTDQAIRLLHSVMARKPVDHSIMSVFVAQPAERFALGQWLARAGRQDEAVSWLGGIGEGSIFDLAYLAPAAYQLAQLLDARGDRRGASAAYQRVAVLYRNADPAFQALAVEAGERARALAR